MEFNNFKVSRVEHNIYLIIKKKWFLWPATFTLYTKSAGSPFLFCSKSEWFQNVKGLLTCPRTLGPGDQTLPTIKKNFISLELETLATSSTFCRCRLHTCRQWRKKGIVSNTNTTLTSYSIWLFTTNEGKSSQVKRKICVEIVFIYFIWRLWMLTLE